MDYHTLSDKSILETLGQRLKALRLRKNMTQQELSNRTTLSLNAIKALESGKGKLSNLIAILRELESLDQLHNFIPEVSISPLQLIKMKGKERHRASGDHIKKKNKDEAEW